MNYPLYPSTQEELDEVIDDRKYIRESLAKAKIDVQRIREEALSAATKGQ
jgi:hypothetical protein